MLYFIAIPDAAAGLALDPMVAQHSVAGGKRAKGAINVKNTGQDPVIVNVETELASGFIGNTALKENWFSVKPGQFLLAPGKSKKVKYSIKPPKEGRGEAALVIFFSENPVAGANSTGSIMIKARNGVTVYCGVKGTEVNSSAIEGLSASGVESGGLKIDISVKNTGNEHIIPRGRIFIKDNNNTLIDDMAVQPQASILPGASKVITVNYDKSQLAPGTYKLNAVLNCSRKAARELIQKETVFELGKQ